MKRHQRTFDRICEIPTRSDIKWSEILSLIKHLGGTIESREGSRVCIKFKGHKINIHTPHPSKEVKRWVVEKIRTFLKIAGD
ncbi:MAG: type II toxin-antitoxin system HicA family toxin [Candidatus Omnitrophota bacterium]|jgi:hypothetical protein|nr:MAG: type II toxin-antitoxin system HicA family toxin [Candidatus Omnitrophota bacterium]